MNVVLVSSTGRCGIREYSYILMDGFRKIGHRVQYIGVKRHDNLDLARCVRQVKGDDDVIIFEYDAGIFRLWGLLWAMAWLRFWRRKRVLLSVHEIEPGKYPQTRQIQWHLARPASRNKMVEVLMVVLSTVDVTWRFLTLRTGLPLLGWLPHVVLVHSPKAEENVRLAVGDRSKVHYVPHVVKRLEGDRKALREELGLPPGIFAFIAPGFLFRRKRIIEVIEQLPPSAELWVVGTESRHESGYLAEIQAYLARSAQRDRVRLIHDYERMERYLLAADAAVFYYADGYQSGVASLAVGAGKPCIFADLSAFADLGAAGMVVRTPTELRQAMVEIQDAALRKRLAEAARLLQVRLSPEQTACRYLSSLNRLRGQESD